MIAYICQIVVLAQAGGQPQPTSPINPTILLWLMATAFLFYFMILRPQKQKDQEHRQKVSNIKENDRVVTIGGIHGIVTNVQRDAERVTIRVDEANGTKIRFSMSAIARVITGDDEETAATASKT